ncbi:MAG: hypothetical protein JW999_09125 [Methanotrichaceae archaeon]|nr:hypothetical protein [Methanotrichaceae archaeon]
MISKTTRDNIILILTFIGVIITAIGVLFQVYDSPNDLHEAKGANVINNTVVNNNVVVIPSNSPKKSTISPESSVIDLDSEERVEAPSIEQVPNKDPSVIDSNTESIEEPKSNIRSSQAKQPRTVIQTTAVNMETRGIDEYNLGEYVPGLGYYLTNEYEKNSLPPDCEKRSVANYCTSPDCCINCLGECSSPGTHTDKNDVTYTCSNGKWTIS